MSLPERITNGSNAVNSNERIGVSPTIQKYAELADQFPQLGLHLSAVEQLNTNKKTRNAELEDEEREALLMYSLWTEDPVAAIEIAEQAGLSERRLNQYVDMSMSELAPISDTLLDIVEEVKRKANVVQAGLVTNTIPIIEPKINPKTAELQIHQNREIIANEQVKQGIIAPPFSIDRSVLYRNTEQAPIHGSLAQSYDHPILNYAQERILFGYYKGGASIEELRRDGNFVSLFDPEDRPKIARIMDQSETVEEVISSCYLRLVDVIARSFHDIPLRDAINTGNIGLLQAARKWVPGEKGRFSTYAVWGIRGAVGQEAYRDRSSVRIPAYVQQDLSKAKWVSEAFQHLFGKTPTMAELRNQLLANTDIPRWRVNTLIRVMESRIQNIGSIHEKLSEDSEDEVANFIRDVTIDVEETAVKRIADEELRRETKRALREHLTPEEQQVVIALYGLDDFGEVTPEELAPEMGATPAQIIDIERKSLAKLKYDKWLREHWAEDPPSFVYGKSAEKAAFRLGLFDDETAIEKLQEAAIDHYEPVATSQPRQDFQNGDVHSKIIYPRETKELEYSEAAGSPSTMEKVRDLRNQGLSGKKIAEQLGISYGTVRTYVSILLKRGEIIPQPRIKTATTASKEEVVLFSKEEAVREDTTIAKVKRLRNEGYNNQEISEMLGVSYGTVGVAAARLIKRGEITPHKPFGDRGVIPEIDIDHSIMARVKQLRNEGLHNNEIATTLGISRAIVGVYTSKLIEAGEIQPHKRGAGAEREQAERAAAKSGDTELVKQYLEAHPRPSYKDGFRRIFDARERRPRGPKGRSPETVEFDKQVRQLLDEEGLTRKKIGEKLGVPATTIDSSMHRMILLGEYTPGRITTHEGWRKRRQYNETQKIIKEAIQAGKDVIQIAEGLETSLQYVQMIVWRLGRRGEIDPTPEQLKPINRAGYVDKNASVPVGKSSEVYKKVTEMRQRGLDNRKIARTLGLPAHRVEVYASYLIRAGVIKPYTNAGSYRVGVIDPNFEVPKGKYYDEVAALRNQGMDNRQIALKLNIPDKRVAKIASKLIRAGVVQPIKISVEERDSLNLQIQELREQGIGSTEIARRLDQPLNRVRNLTREQTKRAKPTRIKPIKRGVNGGREPFIDKAGIQAKIVELRGQGYRNTEIATMLDQPIQRVNNFAKELIAADKIKPLKTGRGNRRAVIPVVLSNSHSVDLSDQQSEIIASANLAKKQEVTLVTEAFSVPITLSEEVETTVLEPQYIRSDRETIHHPVLKGAKNFYTVSDIAKELKVNKSKVRDVLAGLGIKTQSSRDFSRSSREQNEIRLSYAQYEIVKNILQAGLTHFPSC